MRNRDNRLADKAIRDAWKHEKQLVREGKGTRDWTPEQQKELLENGVVYDEEGRAFVGHHMKSAESYPEYQGDYENIQLLSHQEHVAAHAYYGGYRKPCNGFYDYRTGEMKDFGESKYEPCEIIVLSEPIVSISTPFDLEEETNSPSSGDNNLTDSNPNIEASSSHIQNSAKEPSIPEPLIHNAPTEYGFKEFLKDGSKMLFQYIKSHPGEALLKVVSVALTVAPLFSGNSSKGTSRQSSASSNIVSDDVQNTIKEVVKSVADTNDEKRASPIAHIVSGYWKTQNGKRIYVDSYPRGGKKDS